MRKKIWISIFRKLATERTQLKSVLNSLQEKVIQVGYLSEYCENVFGVFKSVVERFLMMPMFFLIELVSKNPSSL